MKNIIQNLENTLPNIDPGPINSVNIRYKCYNFLPAEWLAPNWGPTHRLWCANVADDKTDLEGGNIASAEKVESGSAGVSSGLVSTGTQTECSKAYHKIL